MLGQIGAKQEMVGAIVGRMPLTRAPIRWHVAARMNQVLPQVRGRFRLLGAISGSQSADGDLVAQLPKGLSFEADLRHSGHLFFLQYTPPSLTPIFAAALREGDRAVDVGANEGVYTCLAARLVGPSGGVIAVEPVAPTAARLRRNVNRNGVEDIVEVREVACGSEPGEITVWVPDAGHHALASVARLEASSPAVVTVETIDAVLGGRDVQLIKIDVEGFEAAVVAGAMGTLTSAAPPVVVLEVVASHLERLGQAPSDVLGSLYGAGYECYSLTKRGLLPVTEAGLRSSNILALHKKAHAGVLQALLPIKWPMDQTY